MKAVIIILIFLFLLFWNYGNFASTVVRWCKPLDLKKGKKIKAPKLEVGEKIVCYVPLFQVCTVRKSLYGSYGWTLPVCIISAACIVIRLLNAILFPINEIVMLVTTFMMWLGLLLYAVLYTIVTAATARMYEFSTVYVILVALLPQILCSKMQTGIAHKMRAMHKEDTFSEHIGDTVIKSRHS